MGEHDITLVMCERCTRGARPRIGLCDLCLEAERDGYRSALCDLVAATHNMVFDVSTLKALARARDMAVAVLKRGPVLPESAGKGGGNKLNPG